MEEDHDSPALEPYVRDSELYRCARLRESGIAALAQNLFRGPAANEEQTIGSRSGTNWKYDNSGYVFLGTIIERVSGAKYQDYLKKNIFDPIGMSDSGYDDSADVLPRRASGYEPCEPGTTVAAPSGKTLCNSKYIDMSLPYSAGSLYSTVRDLYKWDRALYTEQILGESSRKLMFRPVAHDYGYGWMLVPMANHKQIGHGGGIPGFSTYIGRFPEDSATIVVLSNNVAANAGGIAAALAETLFNENAHLPEETKPVPYAARRIQIRLDTCDIIRARAPAPSACTTWGCWA